jgi:NADPH:quinone reductase-like Zn-dependent oxidoreductase
MRAAALSSLGAPEVLGLTELPEPQAGPGQIRVRVKAAGVLPFDARVRGGWNPPGLTLDLPVVPGNEFAGLVDQLGEGAAGFVIGDEVLGFTVLNSYAEYVVVPADQLVRKPAGMAWEVAAGFSGNAQGAHMALQALGVGPATPC